jgi:D-lactate dehydrogenase
MKELKAIFDPEGLLNQGVIFNDDPECFIKYLKPLPVLDYDFSQMPDCHTSEETVEQVKRANKCIECGFCEVNCMSCGLTLSSRMRIAVQREIRELEATGNNPERAAILRKQYKYYGDQTCAADGLCSSSCPMKINTGELTHLIRQLDMNQHKTGYQVGEFAANNMAGIKTGLRLVLDVANLGHTVIGSSLMTSICNGLNKAGLPLWTTAMPKKINQPKQSRLQTLNSPMKVVYFPSCINQTMGLAKGAPVKHSLVEETCQLLAKAGYDVIFPKGMEKMCCGQIWESKGMLDIADRKTAELEEALWQASEQGRYPVLCDQSPCLHRMKKCISKMKLYEPAEFIMTFLRERLDFHPISRNVALHLTCSTREMGVAPQLIELARMCSENVYLPEGVGCCGFAGDKGFTYPEVNRYALRKLRPQIEEHHIEVGYSNSRTCEIGLETNSGIPYMSIVYLVNECTTPKKL